jgi:hypothetical protein
MPTWEHFRALCQLQFGPPTQGTHLAELAHLMFTSTVQEYSERYNAVLCHTDDDLGPRQKAKLFVGGLPEHIRVDVEMRHPPDLQTALHYARAEAVTVPHPSSPDAGQGHADGRHPWRVCPDSYGRSSRSTNAKASTSTVISPARLPGACRLLPEVYPGLRHHRGAADASLTVGRVRMGQRRRSGIPGTEDRAHHRPGTPDVGLRQALHGGY